LGTAFAGRTTEGAGCATEPSLVGGYRNRRRWLYPCDQSARRPL